MKNKLKKMLPWLGIIFSIFVIAATSKQLIGPTSATTQNAIVRWSDSSSWKVTNSVVIIDDYGNISGINTQTVEQVNATIGTVTNGVEWLQQTTTPAAADIGGTVGSVTNHVLVNYNGALYDYYSDGTTVWNKKLSP